MLGFEKLSLFGFYALTVGGARIHRKFLPAAVAVAARPLKIIFWRFF